MTLMLSEIPFMIFYDFHVLSMVVNPGWVKNYALNGCVFLPFTCQLHDFEIENFSSPKNSKFTTECDSNSSISQKAKVGILNKI